MVNKPVDMLWNETPEPRWQALMDRADAPFQQSWTYGAVAGALGATVHRIEFRQNGRTLALAQGIERWILRPVTLITMGPVWIDAHTDQDRTNVIQHLRQALPGSFLFTPPNRSACAAFQAAGLADVMTPATLADLSLAPGFRARMHGKWRNRWTTAQSNGVKIRRTTDYADLTWLLAQDRLLQKQRRYRALPAAFTHAWASLDPDSVTLLTADTGSDPIAAMLFLTHGSTATYHVGWTGEDGRKHQAHALILAEAVQRFRENSLQRINLGLIDTENAPGLARFKLGTGAQPRKTGGTWFAF